jgi:hypothetical protein
VQKQTLVPELLSHPNLVGIVDSTLRLFSYVDAGNRVFHLGSISLDESQCLFLEIIQALSIAITNGEYIVILNDGIQKLRQVLGHIAAQSEEELWQSVQEANERAREAEEYVVKYEQRRLAAPASLNWMPSTPVLDHISTACSSHSWIMRRSLGNSGLP